MFDISGKVAIVSGGASGIGLSIVEQLLKNGIKGVSIADINDENGQRAVQDFNEKYCVGKVIFLKVNVAVRNEFEEVFKTTVKTFKNLDIVVNAAGIFKDSIWEEAIAVNLGGTITGTCFAFENYLPKHKSGPEGVIVNISSIVGLNVYPYAPVYSATKSGVVAFSRCYGSTTHFNRNPIRVMVLCPGYTDTPFHRIYPGRMLHESFNDLKTEVTKDLVLQLPTHVAEATIKMIKDGENGSVWVVENAKDPYEVKLSVKEEHLK
ncbi:hypothetical protein FQR65_LT10624 [Abscondita terminalis]|nr:hypothetical protein FQR65_LT10624 [Abscondita terminalis]